MSVCRCGCSWIRDENESDTLSTDENDSWGGLGIFERSMKGLPHALVHTRELVECGGHHGAYTTAAGETSHKHNIKGASKLSRVYASRNQSQEGMLDWNLRQILWSAVIERNRSLRAHHQIDITLSGSDVSVARLERFAPEHKLFNPLRYTQTWPQLAIRRGQPPPLWLPTLLSKDVLVTREELILCLVRKLQMNNDMQTVVLVATGLRWECFGSASLECNNGDRRKVVGVSAGRRDFVRVSGTEDNTALAAQVIMFIKVSGFGDGGVGICLPTYLRNPPTNHTHVILALVRWLSPHPDALLRDDRKNPICPPPFDINHALWEFAELPNRRQNFENVDQMRELHYFPGTDELAQRQSANELAYARYDLIQVESIDTFMNCTSIDNSTSTFLETITLPFV